MRDSLKSSLEKLVSSVKALPMIALSSATVYSIDYFLSETRQFYNPNILLLDLTIGCGIYAGSTNYFERKITSLACFTALLYPELSELNTNNLKQSLLTIGIKTVLYTGSFALAIAITPKKPSSNSEKNPPEN